MAGRGQPRTGGRKRGTPNHMTLEPRAAIVGALDELGGQDYLVGLGKTRPDLYVTLLAKILPLECKADVSTQQRIVYQLITGIPAAPGSRVGAEPLQRTESASTGEE